MASPEWSAWAERHARMFGLASEADAAMLLEWSGVFGREDFTPAELHAATDELARQPPRFRTDHLAGLMRSVREARRRAQQRPPAEDRGTCERCGGSGMAEVPLSGLPTPLAARGLGQGVFAEGTLGVVLCHCALGRWLGERGCPALPWDQYTAAKPGWRDEWEAMRAARRAALRASEHAGRLDRELGEILGRLRGK